MTRPEPRLLFGCDKDVADWVASRVPDMVSDFGKCVGIGVMSADGSRILAGVVYSQYRPKYGTIQASIAAVSPMWATRAVLRGLLYYPFFDAECFKVWACVNIKNTRAQKCIEHIGFKREAILAHHLGKGNHAVISRLFKPDYERLYLNG